MRDRIRIGYAKNIISSTCYKSRSCVRFVAMCDVMVRRSGRMTRLLLYHPALLGCVPPGGAFDSPSLVTESSHPSMRYATELTCEQKSGRSLVGIARLFELRISNYATWQGMLVRKISLPRRCEIDMSLFCRPPCRMLPI